MHTNTEVLAILERLGVEEDTYTNGWYTLVSRYGEKCKLVVIGKDWNSPMGSPVGPALVLFWAKGTTTVEGWDSENKRKEFILGEPEPDWEVLDKLLEELCPDITYLKYKALIRLTMLEEYQYSEHYSGDTTYGVRVLPLDDLVQFVNTMETERILQHG